MESARRLSRSLPADKSVSFTEAESAIAIRILLSVSLRFTGGFTCALFVDSGRLVESVWPKTVAVQTIKRYIRRKRFKPLICGKNMEAGALNVILVFYYVILIVKVYKRS